MAKIAASAHPELKSQIDALTADPQGAPGVVFAAVNKNGEVIFEHASGKVGAGRSEDMTLDNVFWIASCTKMITGVAAMQLVEQGKLALDDVDLVEKLAPVSLLHLIPSLATLCSTLGVVLKKERKEKGRKANKAQFLLLIFRSISVDRS
jgi:hypothetical protein